MSRSRPTWLLAGFGLLVVLAVGVAASTSGAGFGAYNHAWDGTSEFRTLADERGNATVLTDTASYETGRANGTVAFVLAPEEPYTADERARLRGFVENGGTLVVADTAGPRGDELLADVGADARFDGDPLRDEYEYYRSPAFPVATAVADHPFTAGVEAVTLNHGTAVVPGDATVLVATSEYAYLDRDGDERPSAGEETGSYPVVTVEEVGDGRVVTVGDPSIFINAMLRQEGNRAFADALVSSHDRILLDVSHAGAQPPLTLALLAVRASTALQVALGGTVLALVAAAMARPSLWSQLRSRRRRPVVAPSEAALVERLRARHPDWEDERIRRVVSSLRRRRTNAHGERSEPRER